MEGTTRKNGDRNSGGQRYGGHCRGVVGAGDAYPLDKAPGRAVCSRTVTDNSLNVK
jgi:hypothetical protein